MHSRASARIALWLGALLIVTDATAFAGQTELAKILANNELAVRSSLGAPHPKSMRFDLAMQDGTASFDAQYTVTAAGKMRIDIIQNGKRVYSEAYNGHEGWDLDAAGVATTDPAAAALWHGTQYPGQLFTLRDVVAHGHQIKYVGRETINDANYYVLKITLTDGFDTYRYVNPNTWLIERSRDFRAFHPAIDGTKTWIETVWSDYRTIEGIKLAFLSVNKDLTTGRWRATNTVTAVTFNPEVEPGFFERPTSP
jgi:hypothetical protein